MIKNLQYYKQDFEDRTTYYYYIEQKVYVSRKCYVYAFFILFGTLYIGFQNTMWLCFGANLDKFFTYFNLVLVIYWLFYIKHSFKMLSVYCNKVQLLKKVRIEYKDGTTAELSNF